MNRTKLLFAVLTIAATTAVVSVGNAAETKAVTKKSTIHPAVTESTVVHYIGAGSSAMWQGFAIAAYNDFAGSGTAAAATDICNAGTIQTVSGSTATAGNACTTGHWTVKTSKPYAYLHDTRSSSIPLEYGNLWVVWVEDTTSGVYTDIWTYLSVDSTVGVRNYLATPRSKLVVDSAAVGTGGAGAITASFFFDDSSDVALPSAVWTAISSADGVTLTAGMTDIRPEDAKLATERILGQVPSPYGGDTVPTTADNFIYSFALGYGPGPIGVQIKSAEPSSTAAATPVEFSLPGGTDPISSDAVSTTINVYPVGEEPIVFLANRTNTTTGLGQIIPSQPACGATPTVPDCLSSAYTSDGSYQYRNVWDQHPWPAQANVFPNLNDATTGYCSVSANQSSAACHYTRRPLGNLFSGGDCETDSSAFTWPMDPNTQGVRVVPPNGTAEPITLFLREPLSGTYNTTEFSAIRLYGTPGGSSGTNGSGTYESTAYVSQETNVIIGQPDMDPLDLQCPGKFGGENGSTEGVRMRGIGTGEVTTGPNFGTDTAVGDGLYYTPDSIAYAFFSFGNVSHFAHSVNYGYLMIDAIDPLFTSYDGTGGEPGQPVNFYSTGPTGWGELPNCGGTGQPVCSTAAIWGTVGSYPHLRDGTYPAWSELRMMCDPSDAQTTPRCTPTNDPLGAEALVQNLQSDIHNDHTGGVPDLLPFSDASTGALSFNPPYGDVSFIRSHFNLYVPNDVDNAAGQGGLPSGNPWVRTVAPGTSTHQGGSMPLTGSPSDPTVYIDFSTEACSTPAATGGNPVNGPPDAECGGDAGGFIYATGTTTTNNLH